MDDVLVPEVVEQKIPKFIPMEVIEEFKRSGAQALADAKLMPVTTKPEYDMAMVFRRQLKAHIERGKKIADPICTGLFNAHRAACELRTEMIGDDAKADDLLDEKMKEFIRLQRIEEEKLRAQQIAEAKRLEKERQDELAKELEKAGEPEKAEEVRSAPVVYIEPTPPKLTPQGTRKVWQVKSVHIPALAQFVADNPLFAHFLEAVNSALLDYKRDNVKVEIPGVVFEQVDSIAVKR